MITATVVLREQLKKDAIAYLVAAGVTDKALMAKALQGIKNAAYQSCSVDADVRREYREFFKTIPMADGTEFYYKVAAHFAPRHYATIVAFVQRHEAIQEAEWEAEEALEAAIDKEIDYQHDPLGDSEYDEMGCPDFAVCIYPDHIEVRAYAPGMGELLPKEGRKYIGRQGDIRWRYPLSALSVLERMGRPVVNVAQLQVKS